MMATLRLAMAATHSAGVRSAGTVEWTLVKPVMMATKSTGTVARQSAAPSAAVTDESTKAKGATMAMPR